MKKEEYSKRQNIWKFGWHFRKLTFKFLQHYLPLIILNFFFSSFPIIQISTYREREHACKICKKKKKVILLEFLIILFNSHTILYN